MLDAGRGQGTQLLRLVRASDTPMRTLLGEAPTALDTLADNESRWLVSWLVRNGDSLAMRRGWRGTGPPRVPPYDNRTGVRRR